MKTLMRPTSVLMSPKAMLIAASEETAKKAVSGERL